MSASFTVVDDDGAVIRRQGRFVPGGPWERFGLYNSYVVTRDDGRVLQLPAHAGELVPGSTEDLEAALISMRNGVPPRAPMTLELDPTYRCASVDCGSSCFSAAYRKEAPNSSIPANLLEEVIRDFARNGGRIIRFDGGGDPLTHPEVRTGRAVQLVTELGLKSTILTSGDLLPVASLDRLASSGTYLRVSLNAATDATRMAFHGNSIPINKIFSAIEQLVAEHGRLGIDVPVGATFLLSDANFGEVAACARRARDAGVKHFSARRILGPTSLRPTFTDDQAAELSELLAEVSALHGPDFRVAVPWRDVREPDLDPSSGAFNVSQCWQSTLKAVVEPDPARSGARIQLCGRYRGGGQGQRMGLPSLGSISEGQSWSSRWREGFVDYPITRTALPRTCVSCIDRGFILLIERLWAFVSKAASFDIQHFDSPDPQEVGEWRSRGPDVGALY